MTTKQKRDPLLTAKGTRYTYAGWVRVYNAALKNSGSNLAYHLADAYPGHYSKHMEQMRKRDLGTRQRRLQPAKPTKPVVRKASPMKPAPKSKRKTAKKESKTAMEKQPFSAAFPHLERKHVMITYGEYAGRTGVVESTIPMLTVKPTKDNPWILRVRLDGNFKSKDAALVLIPQTYLKRSDKQNIADEEDAAWRAQFNARPKGKPKPFAAYVAEERAKSRKR